MAEGEFATTAKGMPKVTEETIRTVLDSYTKGSEQQWGQHLEEVKARMIEEQPALKKFLESQVGKYPPEMHNALFEIAVATYAVLEQQANSNKLSSSFSTTQEDKG